MRRFKLLIFTLLIFGVSATAVFASELDNKLNDLCKQITANMTQNNKTTIAVIEFSNIDGKITALGKSVAEELTTKLFRTNKFRVIERELLNKVLTEHKFNLSGLVDPGSAKELGKILGVNAIVSGTITELDKTVRLNARLIDTETGSIFGVAAVELKKDGDVNKLLSKVISEPKNNEDEVGLKLSPPDQTAGNNESSILYQTGFDDGNAIGWSSWGLQIEQVDNNYVYSGSGGSLNSFKGSYFEGGADWTDYRFQVRVKPVYDKVNTYFGFQLQFRSKDNRSYIITYDNGVYNLSKWFAKNGIQLTKQFYDSSKSKWYIISVTVQENNIQLMVDNRKVIDFSDTGDLILSGSISLESINTSHTIFDDIKVEAL